MSLTYILHLQLKFEIFVWFFGIQTKYFFLLSSSIQRFRKLYFIELALFILSREFKSLKNSFYFGKFPLPLKKLKPILKIIKILKRSSFKKFVYNRTFYFSWISIWKNQDSVYEKKIFTLPNFFFLGSSRCSFVFKARSSSG